MTSSSHQDPDLALVRECLSGSDEAWDNFYQRFVCLVRTIVGRQPVIPREDIEDVTQSVFLALVTGLKDYDGSYALPKFVCIVAKRICIRHYRQLSAAKRMGEHVRVDENDRDAREGYVMTATTPSQETILEREELVMILRIALENLGLRCRKLLELRYLEELPYSQISGMLGVKENTVTVQTKRCLEELSLEYAKSLRKGVQR